MYYIILSTHYLILSELCLSDGNVWSMWGLDVTSKIDTQHVGGKCMVV